MELAVSEIKCRPDYSPVPVISEIEIEERTIFSIRDDLLVGGTKQRAIIPYLEALIERGEKHFVYASPFSGFAQVALAYACRELNLECTLFCEHDHEKKLHSFSRLAESFGANIIVCESLNDAHLKSLTFTHHHPGLSLIPLGFNAPEFKSILEREISQHWKMIESQFEIKELWVPIGSGTLMSVFKNVVGRDVVLRGVNVNVLPSSDVRIENIMNDANIEYFQSAQKFHEPCKDLPPIPSNLYYDAKLFCFLKQHAKDGAFWCNVAR